MELLALQANMEPGDPVGSPVYCMVVLQLMAT